MRRRDLVDLFTDGMFAAPALKTAQLHANSRSAATYFYLFEYPTPLPNYPNWAPGVLGDDLMYIFGAPLLSQTFENLSPFPNKFLKAERMLSEAIMRYFSNFIKSGYVSSPS